DSLKTVIGGQRAVWRISNGKWQRNCSCGYKNDCCVHLYVGAKIFQQICESEGWLEPQEDRSQLSFSEPSRSRHQARGHYYASQHHHYSGSETSRYLEQQQMSLFGSNIQTSDSDNKILEVEADFRHKAHMIGLRFYVKSGADDERRILRLQQLYNLAISCRYNSLRQQTWSDADIRFLSWLPDRIYRRSEMRRNLQMLKLTRQEFRNWQNVWADTPGRFIERDSQKVLTLGPVDTNMHVELRNSGEKDKVELALFVTTPQGDQYPFYEVYRNLTDQSGEALYEGKELKLNSPLSWSLLSEVFAKKFPQMPKDKVCKYLPTILEERLDILFGPLVERRYEEAVCTIHAGTDGAEIILTLALNGTAVRPETGKAVGKLEEKDDKFIVTEYHSPALETIRELLDAVKARPENSGSYRIPGEPELISELAGRWRQLPNLVTKQYINELQPLLADQAVPQPVFRVSSQDTFTDIGVSWDCSGERLHYGEVREAVERQRQVLRTSTGKWLFLDLDTAANRLNILRANGLTSNLVRMFRPEAKKALSECFDQSVTVTEQRSRQEIKRLLTEPAPPVPKLPDRCKKVMREYQKTGFEFLSDRMGYHLGCILADDMGLGKTLQVLSAMSGFKQQLRQSNEWRHDNKTRPFLVLCPASVIGVWLEETEKFLPELNCQAYRGKPEERRKLLETDDWDALITNYAMVRVDNEYFQKYRFKLVVLDEAQNIKNPEAQVTRSVKALNCERRLALTGTPIENRALDLWSVMDFLNPEFLGTRKEFEQTYAGSEKEHQELARKIAPVILRRTKEQIAPELPARTEETIMVDLTSGQEKIYKEEKEKAQTTIQEKGTFEILAALTRLRQVCCHPDLLPEKEDGNTDSAKLDTLIEMLQEIISENHSVLVFSQFTSMLQLIETELAANYLPYRKITGATPTDRRHDLCTAFNNSPEAEVFLLSLKAAGTGLNLTRADYVFLYDPWWNPAVERQAIDRTHRIGQDKPVIAYKLAARNTVEENVLTLQKEKAELFDQIIDGADTENPVIKLSTEELQRLLGH
ncbi:MAG: DEAD/DEAH box helicase, partial [Lentisphaeria bacterium]